jgi:hypothetical protein
VRHWLNPRCILIALLLVAAPGAALAHLLAAWAPTQIEIVRVDHELLRDAQQLDAELEQVARLQQQTARLQNLATATEARPDWLPERDQYGVFDRLAEAVRDERVTIEQLALGEPGLYAAASRTNLLACEQVSVVCLGDYAALTACLDRICELDLPVRFKELAWHRADNRLELWLQLEVPFRPDERLRETLARDAKLLEKKDEP